MSVHESCECVCMFVKVFELFYVFACLGVGVWVLMCMRVRVCACVPVFMSVKD